MEKSQEELAKQIEEFYIKQLIPELVDNPMLKLIVERRPNPLYFGLHFINVENAPIFYNQYQECIDYIRGIITGIGIGIKYSTIQFNCALENKKP